MGPGHRRNDSAGLPLPRAAHVQEGTSAGRHHASARRPALLRPPPPEKSALSSACGRPSPDVVRVRPPLAGSRSPAAAPRRISCACGRPSPDYYPSASSQNPPLCLSLEFAPAAPRQTLQRSSLPSHGRLHPTVIFFVRTGCSKNLLLLQQDATSSK